MTTREFKNKLTGFENAIKKERPRIALIGALAVLADMSDRIFINGKDKNNRAIGKYSTKPMYAKTPIPQLKNRKFRRVGKTGKKTKSTTYFKSGYKELRQKAGRPTNKVNLDLTSSLRLNLRAGRFRSGAAIGFGSQVEYLKAKGNEDRFKTRIFTVSRKEINLYNRIVNREVGLIASRFF